MLCVGWVYPLSPVQWHTDQLSMVLAAALHCCCTAYFCRPILGFSGHLAGSNGQIRIEIWPCYWIQVLVRFALLEH